MIKEVIMDVKRISYILFLGEDEVKSGIYTLRNIEKSQEYKLEFTDIIKLLKENK